jgi:diguanylate cyclase (GGDEF)-like protein/PAS domain S-box-containing protein
MSRPSDLEVRIRELESENFRLRKEVEKMDNIPTKNNSTTTKVLLENTSQLLERIHRFQVILDHMPALIGYWDKGLRNRFANRAYLSWFGIEPATVAGKHIADVLGEERYLLNLPYIEAALRGEAQRFEGAFPTPEGNQIRHSLAEYIPDIVDGKVLGIFVLVSDITIVKEADAAIKNLAFFDTLTNLPNRRLFNDHLTQVIASNKRSGKFGAVMFLDMDNFKSLNDNRRHGAGDLLLIEAANRIKNCVRETDTVARFGGDEFVVLLNDLDTNKGISTSQAKIVAEKIRDSLSKPYNLIVKHRMKDDEHFEHLCTTSIGVVLFIGKDVEKDEILKWADSSMYRAKNAGGNSVQFYGSEN